jgi:hypothetical protein
MSRCPAILLSLVLPLSAYAQELQTNYDPPYATVAKEEFTNSGGSLAVASGVWVASGGTYNSTSASASDAVATISEYTPEFVGSPPDTFVGAPQYWFRARLRNERGDGRIGILYRYQNRSNYHEVSFSPTGSMLLRTVIRGVATTLATGTYTGGGQGKWFDAELSWTQGEVVVSVNGAEVLRAPEPFDLQTRGRVGLITRNTTAKFDRLRVVKQYGAEPDFRQAFTVGPPPDWFVVPSAGWDISNGAYRSFPFPVTISLPVLNVGANIPSGVHAFQLRSRMLNPSGDAGTSVGIIYNWGSNDENAWNEVVFGPDGIARANRVSWTQPLEQTPLTVMPLATAPYPGRVGQWFDVDFRANAVTGRIDVSVDGTPVFDGLLGPINGPIGVIAHRTTGFFDDLWFNHKVFATQRETFSAAGNPPSWLAVRGTWNTTGGTLNSTAVGVNDLVRMRTWQRSTDYKFSARMLNQFGTSGNRVGVVFGYDPYDGPNADYYEVQFAPTGEAYLNKIIQGQVIQVAKAAHPALGGNVWFTVDLIRHGPLASVYVNGKPVFKNVRTAQLDTPSNEVWVGVTTRFCRARFDNLRFEEYPRR